MAAKSVRKFALHEVLQWLVKNRNGAQLANNVCAVSISARITRSINQTVESQKAGKDIMNLILKPQLRKDWA